MCGMAEESFEYGSLAGLGCLGKLLLDFVAEKGGGRSKDRPLHRMVYSVGRLVMETRKGGLDFSAGSIS